MREPGQHIINQTGDIGAHAVVTQIYAPGQGGFEPEFLTQVSGLPVYSPEWLQFFQGRVPLLGRDEEMAALDRFLAADPPFLWWGVHGPAGIGKSRLAHELVQRNPAWEGGFLPMDRSDSGAASAWQPAGPAIWVVDYAAARAVAVAEMLSVLVRRFSQSPYKIRVLLLERNAGSNAGWWTSMLRQAGHLSAHLRSSLYDEPLELSPLGDEAPHLLTAWLTAGGQSGEEAVRLATVLTPAQLAQATSNGRPLLVGLVAAALHRGDADAGRRSMPDDCIDDYLSRELRLMAASGSDTAFHQACFTLLTSTLMGGQPALTSVLTRTPEPQNAEAILLIQAALRLLSSRGISERSEWALRPDAIGERFIEVMTTPSPTVTTRYEDILPPYAADLLSRLVLQVIGGGKAWSTLSRMQDRPVRTLLILTLLQPVTLRWLLIAFKSIARLRGAALESSYADLLTPELLGDRFNPVVADFIRTGFDQADGKVPFESLKSCLDAQRDREIAVWLIPFLADIKALSSARLHQLCVWYADCFSHAEIHRVRELVLAAELLKRVANGLIPVVQLPEAEAELLAAWDQAPAALPDDLARAVLVLFKLVEARAETLLPAADAEDARELIRAMSLASVQLSYAFMAGAVKLTGRVDRRTWLIVAQYMGVRGIEWSTQARNQEELDLNLRNCLAASSSLAPDREETWTTRWGQMKTYAESGDRWQPWTDLATDAVRVAWETGHIDPACRMAEEASETLAGLAVKDQVVSSLLETGAIFQAIAERELGEQRWDNAVKVAMAYLKLITLSDVAQDPASSAFPTMMWTLADHAVTLGDGAVMTCATLAEQLFDPVTPQSDHSLLAVIACSHLAGLCLRDDRPQPFNWLEFQLIAPSDELLSATRGTEVMENAKSYAFLRATSAASPGFALEFAQGFSSSSESENE